MKTLARVLVGIAVLRVWRSLFRAPATPSPVAPASTRGKVGVSPHLCAVPRGHVTVIPCGCRGCEVAALAYANRDACERAS